jgi:hypothetical protein
MLRQFGGALAVAVVLFAGGCANKLPVFNVAQAPVTANKSNVGTDDVRQAIVRAGSGLGWQMNADRPGHITGRLMLRTHIAIVDIDYTPKNYSIKYRDSTNLEYDGTGIHKNYNGWIQNLDKAIQVQLQNL